MKHASILTLLAAFAIPAVATAANAAEAPKPLGVFKSWTAATYGNGSDKACYAFVTSKVEKGSKAKPAMLTVTERASFRDEISLSQGISYSKDAKVVLAVGSGKYDFFTKDSMAYALKGAATIQAFLGGSSVTATTTDGKAKPVSDMFGLDGFSDAYKAIQKACPAAPGAKSVSKTKG